MPAPRPGRRTQPLYIAAGIGLVLACFEIYLLIAWIAGPNFTEVTPGPSVPPTWMKIAIHTSEVLCVALAAFLVYRFVIRPWRREQRVPFDGLLVLTGLATSVYDPLSCFFHPWFAYNSALLNMGTPMSEVPGWQSFHAPGQQLAWPILFIPPLYTVFFLVIPAVGCGLMRATSRRWPRLPSAGHVAICLVTIFLIDTFTEGTVIMRLGFYEHTGSSFSSLDSYYGHNALRNIIFVTITVTAAVCLRYYRNDRGETIVERGAHRINASPLKKTILRFFAVLTAIQALLFFGFHVPLAISTLISPNTPWHADMRQHSYLNDHLCGYGTPRHCPPT
ncbi:MAG: spirocyclase AveC family protein [Solirubrobacteraceae bacterium]